MDFLDPKKERRTRTMLLLGYALIALAIGIATLVLLYYSYGYSIDRQGNVTQSGRVFISSQPSGATIALNGNPPKANTNASLVVSAGTYSVKLSRTNYRDWQRQIVVAGGDVQHFDYPFLFPKQLQSTNTELIADPSMSTQSPDKRWLLLGESEKSGSFLEYDLKNPAKPVQTNISLPDTSFTPGDGAQAWSAVEWASDNRHVLLLHTYVSGGVTSKEYILLNRDTPLDSISLTASLKLAQDATPNLYNKKVDSFYIYDSSAQTLRRVSADGTSTEQILQHIVAYKTYGNDMVLYVTDTPPTGKAVANQLSVVLQDGQKTFTLRTVPAGATTYNLELAQYSGDWYVMVGANNDKAAYIYKNPQSQPITPLEAFPAPWRRLPVANPSYVAFSDNAQFVLAENGQDFVVYDFENVVQYHYKAAEPIDQPQTHATWMDGNRLLYTSGGKLLVFDYDYRNRQILQADSAAYAPVFAPNYSYVYSIKSAASDAKPTLTSTALTVK